MVVYYTSAWHNYATGETDYIEEPTTDAQALQYLPQSTAAIGLYNCYRQLGQDILTAMANVLSASVGQECPYPVKVAP